jgi:hypothetical protein
VIRYADLLVEASTAGGLPLFFVDRLPFVQCASLCAILDIPTRALSVDWLRTRLKDRLQYLAKDDAMLLAESVEGLSMDELSEACFERGLAVLMLSRASLREQLEEWLKIRTERPDVIQPLLVYWHAFQQHDLWLQKPRDDQFALR